MTAAGYAEVIGDPIAGSRSPAIHKFWLEKAGIDGDYRATRVNRADLPDFLADRRRDPAWRGCNVTMPLKLDALMLADTSSDLAVTTGAANLLIPRDGRLLAGNTDVGGVFRVLGPRFAGGAPGDVTLLGNGGGARAVLVALHMLDVTDIRIQARDLSAAYRLAVEFGLDEHPRMFNVPITTQGLVNATPMGMTGVTPHKVDIGAMPAAGWVFDMVTDPIETDLLRSARECGLAAIGGLAMLVEQAADSFQLLFGSEAPRAFDEELMVRLEG